MAHTPGPWHTYPMPTKTMIEAKANRQLAIASPDLLAALKALQKAIAHEVIFNGAGCTGTLVDIEKQAHAAIAKAEGKEPSDATT